MADRTYKVFSPAKHQMASTETQLLGFDWSDEVAVGESITAASCTLTRLSDNKSYAAGLSGSASISATTVTQVVTALEAGEVYRLANTITIAANKVLTRHLIIECQV